MGWYIQQASAQEVMQQDKKAFFIDKQDGLNATFSYKVTFLERHEIFYKGLKSF